MPNENKTIGCVKHLHEKIIQFERYWMKSRCFNHTNKVVLITGASSGIGRATAIEFAAAGAVPILVGRDVDRLNTVLEMVKPLCESSFIIAADLTLPNASLVIIEQVKNKSGRHVDVLVNCAGIGVLGFVEDVPLKSYEAIMEINFFAVVKMIKAVIPAMRAHQTGQIINITSGVALRGLPGVSPYCVSKAALLRLSESLRVEMIQHNIDIIDVSPGLVRSNFENNLEVHGAIKENFANGRGITAQTAAKHIVKASRQRSRYVSLSKRSKLMSFLNIIIPSIVDKLLARRVY